MGADGGRWRFSLPPRFDSVGQLRQSVLKLYGDELIDASTFAEVEETVQVGVIDSVYDPGEEFADANEIGRTVDLLPNEPRDDTTGHGRIVAGIISAFSETVEFHFYRATQATEGGTIWERHLLEGLGRAHLEDEVDVVNLSVGNDHSGDGNEARARGRTPCKLGEATRMAIEDGIVVVGAAGNESQFDSVCCPALQDEAICVGGFVPECDFRLEDDDPMSLAGRYSRPPKACWIDQPHGVGADGVFLQRPELLTRDVVRAQPANGRVEGQRSSGERQTRRARSGDVSRPLAGPPTLCRYQLGDSRSNWGHCRDNGRGSGPRVRAIPTGTPAGTRRSCSRTRRRG